MLEYRCNENTARQSFIIYMILGSITPTKFTIVVSGLTENGKIKHKINCHRDYGFNEVAFEQGCITVARYLPALCDSGRPLTYRLKAPFEISYEGTLGTMALGFLKDFISTKFTLTLLSTQRASCSLQNREPWTHDCRIFGSSWSDVQAKLRIDYLRDDLPRLMIDRWKNISQRIKFALQQIFQLENYKGVANKYFQ